MTADQLRRSPLDGLVLEAPAVRIAELPFSAEVNLRADPSDTAVAEVLGGLLPSEPNTVAALRGRHALWLGPDEWLVVGPDGDAPELVGRLHAALAGSRGSAVDVSANRTTIEVSGERATDLLEKGCQLDLHPRAFAAGHCAQTMVAKAQVILWQTDQTPTYRLLVRGSFAGYLAAWLTDAAREYLP
ncbi:sarcosine oxidase subunit gamma [Pseudonocardia acaciae]|uniref:sarcosine oxidase subunit gamma n=1 Tax=Pseudonocardia acaciae TaxID=551276 RepID=UPI0005619933|nr:sarcosine oxidase subunit gamma family protein [Pseudonocardia acaciae]